MESDFMSRTIYKNALLNGKIIDVTVENGKIISLEQTQNDGFDLKGKKVFAGLIDIHTHGCVGLDVTRDAERLEEIAVYQASSGITSFYPTTVTTDEETMLKAVSTSTENLKGANILGFHMEGPYISPERPGALNPKYILKPDTNGFKKYPNVKIVTVAPEVEGAAEFIKNCDAMICLGHSVGDYESACAAADAGAKCLTHTFNVMPPLLHREPGLIGAALDKDMYAQAICDGIHIHPAAIRALYKMFGKDRMVLISDCVEATGIKEDGEYLFGGVPVVLKDGVVRTLEGNLAGSTTNLFDCVKCAISFGIPEKDAFQMASGTPAKLMGLNKGKIEVGFDADFITVDDDYNLCNVVINGEIFK